MQITIDDLLNNGYDEIPLEGNTKLLYPYTDRLFQKRVKDDRGTKYFITVMYYDASKGVNTDISQFEFEIYSYIDEVAIHTLFYGVGVKTLTQIEQLIDDYFVNAKCSYYEVKDE